MLDIFPSGVRDALRAVEREHGRAAMERIYRYVAGGRDDLRARSPLQRGTHILPGLTATPWHDLRGCDALGLAARELEIQHAQISQEFNARVGALEALVHYARNDKNKGWRALYLYEDGMPVLENHPYFPATVECVRRWMLPHLYPLGEVHFSILEPGAHIPPHCDQHNFTLSFHLAIDVPEGCGIRVAGETREWRAGECLLFDHSFEHEAWNRSGRRRVVLIMDVWNPETTAAEREALMIILRWLYETARTHEERKGRTAVSAT